MRKHFVVILICFCSLACAKNLASAQDSASLPSAPAQSWLPDAPTPMVLLDQPVRTAQPDQPAPPALPDDPETTPKPKVDATTGVPQREATWRSMPGDFLHDQKDLWSFPWQLAKGRHWKPTLIVLGGTVGLIYADPKDAPYFRNHQKNWDKVNDVFDPSITSAEVFTLPAGLMTAGYIRHDDREVNTALLAAEAYGDSAIINLAMKAVTRRARPSDVPVGGDFGDTFFKGGKSPFKGSSFPSGHSSAVWSVATVVAERYRNRGKPWIPVLSYTLATAICFSRITTSAHFPSDVFLGSTLGYTIAKYQTLKPR